MWIVSVRALCWKVKLGNSSAVIHPWNWHLQIWSSGDCRRRSLTHPEANSRLYHKLRKKSFKSVLYLINTNYAYTGHSLVFLVATSGTLEASDPLCWPWLTPECTADAFGKCFQPFLLNTAYIQQEPNVCTPMAGRPQYPWIFTASLGIEFSFQIWRNDYIHFFTCTLWRNTYEY